MTTVYGFRPGQPVSWFAVRKSSSNQHCLYCGAFVGDGSAVASNREHLIARNFVPDGMLDSTAFNFVFRACVECNSTKADAERHISSVTLLNSRARLDNRRIDEIALRKASKDFHPGQRGVPVRDASIQRTFTANLGALSMTFGMEGPPQLDVDHAVRLACYQTQALFSLVTTQDPRTTTQLLDPAHWQYLGIYPWRDWGNVQLVEIQKRVRPWPVYARIDTANGFFRAVLRANDGPPEEWFWGLEWNHSHRVVGRLGREKAPSAFDNLPSHEWKPIGPTTRIREEIPPGDEDEFLPAS